MQMINHIKKELSKEAQAEVTQWFPLAMKKYNDLIENPVYVDLNAEDLYELIINALVNTSWIRNDNTYNTTKDYKNDFKFGTLFQQQLKSELSYYFSTTSKTQKQLVIDNTLVGTEESNNEILDFIIDELDYSSSELIIALSEGLNEEEQDILKLKNQGLLDREIKKMYSKEKLDIFYEKTLFNLKCYKQH